MKRILLFSCVFIFSASLALACIDFSVGFSTEVFLTKPGIQYDLSVLSQAVDTKNKEIHFNTVEGLAYVSHYNDKVIAIVAQDALREPASDDSEDSESQGDAIKGLDVMIQVPYEFKKGGLGVKSIVNINQDKFDFAQAMKTELQWLLSVGVIQGLSQDDINKIVSLCTQYTSGVGGRVMYANGQWMLSEQAQGLEGVLNNNIPKGISAGIPRGGSCSGGPDPKELMELVQ